MDTRTVIDRRCVRITLIDQHATAHNPWHVALVPCSFWCAGCNQLVGRTQLAEQHTNQPPTKFRTFDNRMGLISVIESGIFNARWCGRRIGNNNLVGATQMTDIHTAAVLQTVKKDIAELEAKLAQVKAFAVYLESQPEPSPTMPPKASEAKLPNKTLTSQVGPPESLASKKQFEAAAIVLRDAGRSMRTAEIAEAMLTRGFKHPNPRKLKISLFTILDKKKDMFAKAEKGFWILRDSDA